MTITINDAEKMAQAFIRSGLFGNQSKTDVALATVKIIAGAELGFGPFASMTGVNIIKGKIAMGANLMAAAVKGHPDYDYKVLEHSETVCRIAFFQNGTSIGESVFTLDDAKKAGLLTNSVWTKFPRNMLFARAISNGTAWHCPDVFFGQRVYHPEEMGAEVDENDNVIGDIETIGTSSAPPREIEIEAELTGMPLPPDDASDGTLDSADREAQIEREQINSKPTRPLDADTLIKHVRAVVAQEAVTRTSRTPEPNAGQMFGAVNWVLTMINESDGGSAKLEPDALSAHRRVLVNAVLGKDDLHASSSGLSIYEKAALIRWLMPLTDELGTRVQQPEVIIEEVRNVLYMHHVQEALGAELNAI